MASDAFPVGTVLATPFAFDDVDTHHSTYTYRLRLVRVQGSDGSALPRNQWVSPLDIHKQSGVVRLSEDLRKFPAVRTLTYTVEATDEGNSRLRARAKLLVHVLHTAEGGEGAECCCLVYCNSTLPAP
jgi:hypothetical protein